MRAKAVLLMVGLCLGGMSAATAGPPAALSEGPAGLEALVQQTQWGGGYCERLRRACVYKEYRGEVGEGNCRRYRAECLNANNYCERLRRACIYKEYRGEVGEGNCRRYRNECGR